MSIESNDYYNRYINLNSPGECNCDDCTLDRFDYQLDDMFDLFGVYFIPLDYKESGDSFSYSADAFAFFWNKLEQIKNYNIEMERKKEESGTNKSLINCVQCGRLTYKNKNRVHGDGDAQLCLSCVSKYAECSYCNTLVRITSDGSSSVLKLTIINNDRKEEVKKVCGACYDKFNFQERRCSDCGRHSNSLNDIVKIPYSRDSNDKVHYHKYCIRCADHFNKCSTMGCKEFTRNRFCSYCVEDQRGLNSYDFKPINRRFHYSSNEKNINIDSSLFFGFELETEQNNSHVSNDTMALLVKEVVGKDYIYCMKDGSLSSGIEIASFPYTWDWYKKEGKDKWTNMLLFLKGKDWVADRFEDGRHPVGLHVHTTKAAWTSLQIYKLIQFVYNPTNRSLISKIAGRKPGTYCQISSDDYDKSIKLAKEKRNLGSGHYSMINLNRKEHSYDNGGKTIEFRMFRGSLEPYIFHKNLEFVQATYMFTRDYPKKDMFEGSFTKFILSNKKEYPCLSEFIKSISSKRKGI